MSKYNLIISVSLLLILLACKDAINKQSLSQDTTKCIKDTVLNNGNKITYSVAEKDSLCFMSISINKNSKINIDSFYYAKNECRMIPKLFYSTNYELFLISGTGSHYRLLYNYYYENNVIVKNKTEFDIMLSNENDNDNSDFSYYPYFKNNKLYVLKIDIFKNISKHDTKIELTRDKVISIQILQNNLIILQSNHKEVIIKI